jgi:hypothetical protein
VIESREIESVLPRQAFATAALVWMAGVAVFLGTQIWGALHLAQFGIDGPSSTKWVRMSFLAQTGGLYLALAALAGLVLVALAGPARARAASVLGVAFGLWTIVAGVMGVIVAIHGDNSFAGVTTLGGDNRLVLTLTHCAGIAFGATVTLLAMRLLSVGGGLTDPVS